MSSSSASRVFFEFEISIALGTGFGSPGFVSREVDPTGAQSQQADSLCVVYWWLAVILETI